MKVLFLSLSSTLNCVFFFLDRLRPFSVSESRAKVITAFGTRN